MKRDDYPAADHVSFPFFFFWLVNVMREQFNTVQNVSLNSKTSRQSFYTVLGVFSYSWNSGRMWVFRSWDPGSNPVVRHQPPSSDTGIVWHFRAPPIRRNWFYRWRVTRKYPVWFGEQTDIAGGLAKCPRNSCRRSMTHHKWRTLKHEYHLLFMSRFVEVTFHKLENVLGRSTRAPKREGDWPCLWELPRLAGWRQMHSSMDVSCRRKRLR